MDCGFYAQCWVCEVLQFVLAKNQIVHAQCISNIYWNHKNGRVLNKELYKRFQKVIFPAFMYRTVSYKTFPHSSEENIAKITDINLFAQRLQKLIYLHVFNFCNPCA